MKLENDRWTNNKQNLNNENEQSMKTLLSEQIVQTVANVIRIGSLNILFFNCRKKIRILGNKKRGNML